MSNALEILVLEDDALNRDVITLMLKRSGYAAFPVDRAEDAFQILEEVDIKLMLIDINLPGMTGNEFLDAVRENPRFEHIPAIAVTANPIMQLPENSHAGFQEYVAKPFTIQEIIKAIRKHLEE